MTMKKLSLAPKILIPALLLFIGVVELYLVYLMQAFKTQFGTNLSGFFINLVYGIAVGFIYLFYEKRQEGIWMIHLPRLFLLLLPMLIVSVYFIAFGPRKPLLIDTMGMPYLSFIEIFYGESLTLHVCYFCSGFFLVSLLSKDNAINQKKNWVKHLFFSILFILLIFLLNFGVEKILSHELRHLDLSYYTYEILVLFANIIFGILLWGMLNLTSNTSKKYQIKKKSYLIAGLFFVLMGCIPFLFIYISYQTDFTIPYNNPYYYCLRFFRQSDFWQVFQILFGLTLIPAIKSFVSKNSSLLQENCVTI